MKETLNAESIVFAPDFDGVYKRSSTFMTSLARTAEQSTKGSRIGQTLFDRTARSLYKLQPVVPGAVEGSDKIVELLERNGRRVWHEILSNRPSEHTQLTLEELILMGINPNGVVCVGTDPYAKSDHIQRRLLEGHDVIQIEDNVREATRAAMLNTPGDSPRVVSYLFQDHSGGKSHPWLVRINSFQHVVFDLEKRLIPLTR